MLEDRLIEYGCDVKGAILRFLGRKDLYLSLVKSFLEDPSFSNARKAAEEKDAEAFFHAVHSLKGVSGNLGFTKLYEVSAEICSYYRGMRIDDMYNGMSKLSILYEEMCDVITGN